jgi:ceramide glucosyltransferase
VEGDHARSEDDKDVHSMTEGLMVFCAAVAVGGCVYALVAAVMVRRFGAASAPTASIFPGVTILKPLRGAEPHLYDNLVSFCNQNYAGPVQVLFGVQQPTDTAIAVVERVIADTPGRDLELVIHSSARGPNPKVANLIGMQERIRHHVLVLADSDIWVAPDYLERLVAALNAPGVGLVTCLYRGEPQAGGWSRLDSMAIDYHFLPDVLVGLQLGLARPCFGSTIALRRETLAAIGGFEAFVHRLADDNAMGEAVRDAGMQVAIPHFVVVHSSPIGSAGELWRHQLRWARTVRSVSPLGYAGLGLTHPLPFALVAAWQSGFGALGAIIIAASIACRLVLQVQVDHTLHVRPNRWWLGPVSDLLSFVVYVAGFFVRIVSWRGIRYKVDADGTLVPLGEPKA